MFVCTVGHWDLDQVFTEQWTVQVSMKTGLRILSFDSQ